MKPTFLPIERSFLTIFNSSVDFSLIFNHDFNFKEALLKTVIARSPVYFIVLMLILYDHFYFTSFTDTLCVVDVSVSVNSNVNGPSINIFDRKASTLVFITATSKR